MEQVTARVQRQIAFEDIKTKCADWNKHQNFLRKDHCVQRLSLRGTLSKPRRRGNVFVRFNSLHVH